ncbi:EI24 domain-containing protein [soil metagenome]
MTDFARGAGYLGKGWSFLRSRPRLLLVGMLPALIVFLVLTAAFVVLLVNVGDLVSWATPFADDWTSVLRQVLRVLLAIAVLVGALLLSSALFVGLTLTVGDPFYERIWRETEAALGGPVPDHEVGFWRSARDGLRLVAVGLGFSALVLLSGFVPVIGPAAGITLGIVFSGRLLARELLGRPLGARGLDDAGQRDVVTSRRSVVLGFGVMTQLCFLVPLGGVLVMPAAVAGATILAREELWVD